MTTPPSGPSPVPGTPQQPGTPAHGQASANQYGQQSADQYGQASANQYGQPSANHYGHASANQPGQPYAQPATHGTPAPGPQAWAPGAAPIAAPEKKKSRWPLWTAIGCGILALIVILAFAGCAALIGSSASKSTTTVTTESSSSAAAGDDAKSDDAGKKSDAAEKKAESGKPDGSREHPITIGKGSATFGSTDGEGEVTTTLGAPDWDAQAKIMKANQFNEKAPEGQVYVLVPVTMSYKGKDKVTPWVETRIEFVADSGNAYDQAAVVTPKNPMELGDLYDGGKAEYDVAILIPKDQVKKGKFRVSSSFSFDTKEAWFTAS